MIGDLFIFLKKLFIFLFKTLRFFLVGMWICLWALLFIPRRDRRRQYYLAKWRFNYYKF